MALDKSNVIVDRYVRFNGYDKTTGERMYTLTQIQDANLSVSIDNSTDITDAQGAVVETLERGISAEFTAANAFFSFDLFRHQLGASYDEATEQSKILTPMWEEFTLAAGATTTLTLKQTPAGTAGAEIPFIYVVPAGGGAAKSYAIGEEASATNFTLAAGTKTITLPTGLNAGDKVYVEYEYESSNAFKITKTALDQTKEHRAVALVLCHDLCDKNTQYAAWQIFPSAKFSQEIDQDFAPDANHPFTLRMTQDVCSDKRLLFEFVCDGAPYAQ